MKIRNKKTGEIWKIPKKRNLAVQENDISFCATLGTNGKMFSYRSLAELNEEWEDYKPKSYLFDIPTNIEPTKDQDTINLLRSENAYLRGVITAYEKFLKDKEYIKEEENGRDN